MSQFTAKYNPRHLPTRLTVMRNGQEVIIQNSHLLPMLRHTGTIVKIKPSSHRDVIK